VHWQIEFWRDQRGAATAKVSTARLATHLRRIGFYFGNATAVLGELPKSRRFGCRIEARRPTPSFHRSKVRPWQNSKAVCLQHFGSGIEKNGYAARLSFALANNLNTATRLRLATAQV